MESSLTPRDIQARIRAGESVEDVARSAGVTPERLGAFAAPVIAEREHVAGLAQMYPVRRRGETTSTRSLRNAVSEFLATLGLDFDEASWDSWKVEGRRWQVAMRWSDPSTTQQQQALFLYEQQGRFSVASDDAARRVLGDLPPVAGAVHRDLAMIYAVQSPANFPGQDDAAELSPAPIPEFVDTELPDFDEPDSVEENENDALYDMISSFDEDSVKIFAGLMQPDDSYEDTGVIVSMDSEPESMTPAHTHEDTRRISIMDVLPTVPPAPVESSEPIQPSLIEGDEPAPAPKPKQRRRASVPSWDEIMFGAPRHSD